MTGESLRVEFRRQVRERVLEAAHRRTVEIGWDRVRVGEIAVESGVSRPTLYREFGNKDGLGEALVTREADRFFASIAAVLEEHDEAVCDAVAAAARFTLVEAESNPLLRAVLTGSRTGDSGLLPFLTTRSGAIVENGRTLLTEWVARREPEHAADTVDEVMDDVVRLVISHLVAPSVSPTQVGDRIARLVRLFLAPSSRDRSCPY